LIGTSRDELALDQICRTIRAIFTDRGSALASTHDALQPNSSHQSLEAAAGDGDALPAELSEDLASALDLEVLIIEAPNLVRELDIAPHPRRQALEAAASRALCS
jgi:hypothetical protein